MAGGAARSRGGGKEREIKLSTRPRPPLQLCALALLSAGLLFATGAAQGAATGRPFAWGCGGSGGSVNWRQCSVPSGLSGVTAIAGGSSHRLALKGDGSVVAWGCADTDHRQPACQAASQA